MRPNDGVLGENVVNRFVEFYKNTGRNITPSSLFTSLIFAKCQKTKLCWNNKPRKTRNYF